MYSSKGIITFAAAPERCEEDKSKSGAQPP